MTPRVSVLVVDDDRALLEALPETLRLRMPDADVDVCDSASAALERILATDYDVIVTDIKMPGMDGLALLDEIRVLRPDTPTLLVTGHGEHDLAVRSLRAGAYDYMQKPLDREYLVASLRRAVQVRQLKRRVAEQQAALERHATELERVVQARTQELREAIERVRALTEVAAAIHAARDVDQVLRSVAEAACRLSGAAFAIAGSFRGHADASRLPDGRAWALAAARGRAAEHVDTAWIVRVFAHVCARGESARLDGAAHPLLAGGAAPVGSCVAAPVRARGGQVLGAIAVGHPEPRRFTAEVQAQIEALAGQAAVALENALLYERERGIAETLQRSLLPERLPEIPGLTLAARYFPASREAVGGDWYDVFPLPTGHIALAMGDVAGRGVWAAAIMGQLRNALRAYAVEGNPPAVVAERLNRLIDPGTMATLLYLVFDPATWAVRYVNLGHPPALIVTPGGGAAFLPGGAPPLGTLYSPPYEEGAITLQPGSTILLYTDGLVDHRGEPVDEGLARVREIVSGSAGLDVEGLLDRLLREALPNGGAADDVAALALRASELDPSRVTIRLPAVPSSLITLRHTLRRWLAAGRVRDEEAYEVLTACNEACANTIEHAYGPADAVFELDATNAAGEITVTVHDSGRWREARDGQGRWLGLMRALMDTVEVTPGPGGTSVRMRRRLARDDAGAPRAAPAHGGGTDGAARGASTHGEEVGG